MLSKRNNKGFTLAETLLVVLIIIVLVAVAFVSVITYQRNMTKLEYDGYAKEIFIAAQNHLTMLEGQGYLGLDSALFGKEEEPIPGQVDTGDGVYYFVVNISNTSVDGYASANASTSSLLNLMLPFASIDDTVRVGGQYIVRYHKDSAQVLDVFYWSEHANPERFSFKDYTGNTSYSALLGKRSDSKALKEYGESKSVVGYYGGATAASLTHGSEIKTPTIKVVNAEALYVLVTDNNSTAVTSETGYQLKLVLTGVTSYATTKKSVVVPITVTDIGEYKIYLDDITADDDSLRFWKQFSDLIPGEDIEIYAVAFNNNVLSNVAYSATKTTNSLFADGTDATTAKIAYFRHLENLDDNKSHLSTSGSVSITKAEQITDLAWKDDTFADAAHSDYTYAPVSPDYALEYNGASPLGTGGAFTDDTVIHSISNLAAASAGSAGVFGELNGGKVANLKLVDLKVTGTNAGALAGKTTDTNVTNVLAVNSDSGTATNVTASGSAGGLIGSVAGGTVSRCAAALVVSSTGDNAGGLIGSMSDGAVSTCYSGGHTTNGSYSSSAFNVTSAATAGGLIGSAGSATITDCYSTCSASGATVGGLVGSAGGRITDCYATGLIGGGASAKGAFAGTLTGTVSGCQYYKIINEIPVAANLSGSEGYTYLKAVNGADYAGITAFDESASDYNSFVGAPAGWEPAVPYDTRLFIYKGNYSLDGLKGATGVADADFVATHYGDWPAPEVWIVNK